MYDLKNLKFNELLKEYRKSKKITLDILGNKIGKTKATISKYENGEIIPDIITVLEICNELNLSLSQLFPTSVNNNRNNIIKINPFNVNKLYLYYYTEHILIKSIIEIIQEQDKIFVKLYNGIKDYNTYADNSSYYYEGILETDKTIGYMTLSNTTSSEIFLEKLQISFSLPWSKNFSVTPFFISALTPNAIPIIKKGIISKSPITDLSIYKDDLIISQNELDEIQKNNAWILKNKNYDRFLLKN